MDTSRPELIPVYLESEYRVRLPQGGHAAIRIGQPLPDTLARILSKPAIWALLTAWNPGSAPRCRQENRRAQKALLAQLKGPSSTVYEKASIRAAVGVSTHGPAWREPSLFVIGLYLDTAKQLALEFGQYAIVVGSSHEPAKLVWCEPPFAGVR